MEGILEDGVGEILISTLEIREGRMGSLIQ